VKRSYEIVNKLGLHARAAAQFVKTASAYDAELTISKDGQTVNGKSIMGIMMLAAGSARPSIWRPRGTTPRPCSTRSAS